MTIKRQYLKMKLKIFYTEALYLYMPIKLLDSAAAKFKWLDITEPTKAELEQVSKDFQLHGYTLKDCLEPDHLPKVEELDNCRFIITRLPVSAESIQHFSIRGMSSKLAIFYNDDFLITVHRLPQAFLEETKAKYVDSGRTQNTNELVTKIIWQVLNSYEAPLLRLTEELELHEARLFLKSLTQPQLKDLYFLKRQTEIFYKLLLLTDEVIKGIGTDQNDQVAYQDVKDLHHKLITLYNQLTESLSNLLNTYISLSAQKTNEVMKTLTIFSMFFMPLTFIVGIYGMNFEYMPELKQQWAYPAVLLLMVLVTFLIFWWVKRKRWL
ncbi:MAG: hypothetical protein RLZ47_841 [Bacteroidota bacterium]|jgi:magnesium transporter